MSFADELRASFPTRLPMPDVIHRAVAWMESQGFVSTFRDGSRYCLLHPADDPEPASTIVHIHPVDPSLVEAWTRTDDPAVNGRLAPFVRTGGDGSHAALWRDDEGGLRYVHMGSGSGSTMLSTLFADPVDLLRFLALGYVEAAWPEIYHLTPEQAFIEENGDGAPRFVLPRLLRRYVETRLDAAMPKTASEIVVSTATMDADTSEDPFWNWMRRLQDS